MKYSKELRDALILDSDAEVDSIFKGDLNAIAKALEVDNVQEMESLYGKVIVDNPYTHAPLTTHQLDSTVQVAANVAHRDGFQAGFLMGAGLFSLLLVAFIVFTMLKKLRVSQLFKESQAKTHALEIEIARLSGMLEAKGALAAQTDSTSQDLQALRERVNGMLKEESERLERWKSALGGSSTPNS